MVTRLIVILSYEEVAKSELYNRVSHDVDCSALCICITMHRWCVLVPSRSWLSSLESPSLTFIGKSKTEKLHSQDIT